MEVSKMTAEQFEALLIGKEMNEEIEFYDWYQCYPVIVDGKIVGVITADHEQTLAGDYHPDEVEFDEKGDCYRPLGDLVCEEFACPKCKERFIDNLQNDENHVTCTCGHEYDIVTDTFFVTNPWSCEKAEVSEAEVTQEKLDFLTTLMDDDIREAIHNSEDCPTRPGAFFRKYVEIVGPEEAGRIWFA